MLEPVEAGARRERGRCLLQVSHFLGPWLEAWNLTSFLISRKYGVWVFECKGARLANIREIQGQEWQMQKWYADRISPVQQAEDQMWEVKAIVERERTTRHLGLTFDYRVILPFITEEEWQGAGFADHPTTQGVVLTKDGLERAPLRRELQTHGLAHMPELTDDQWQDVLAVFRGTVSDRVPVRWRMKRQRTARCEQSALLSRDCVSSTARRSASRTKHLKAHNAFGASQVPARPCCSPSAPRESLRRIQTGTSRSCSTRAPLYQQIRALIANAYEQLTTEPLDPERINIWHAWGGKDLTGFYREASLRWDERPLTLNDATKALGSKHASSEGFGWVCDQLEQAVSDEEG